MSLLSNNAVDQVNQDIDREYIGTVENHEDPMKLGRLQIRVPEIYGDIPKEHLPWANPSMGFGGGKNYGIFMIPPPGSKVRIRLFRGHPWTPEWIGTHWFDKEPPQESQLTQPHNYVIKTPKGHLIDLHDDRPYIRIKDKNGNFIILNTEKDNLEIKVGKDGHVETGRDLDESIGRSRHTSTGKVLDEKIGSSRRTKAQASISFDAGVSVHIKAGGTLNLQAGGAINILAGGAVNIDGASVNIMSGAAQPAMPEAPGS